MRPHCSYAHHIMIIIECTFRIEASHAVVSRDVNTVSIAPADAAAETKVATIALLVVFVHLNDMPAFQCRYILFMTKRYLLLLFVWFKSGCLKKQGNKYFLLGQWKTTHHENTAAPS